MNIDLPPSSAFAPDPAVARRRSMRGPLTLTLPVEQAPLHATHEFMSGSISTNAAFLPCSNALRTAIAPADEMVLTITF